MPAILEELTPEFINFLCARISGSLYDWESYERDLYYVEYLVYLECLSRGVPPYYAFFSSAVFAHITYMINGNPHYLSITVPITRLPPAEAILTAFLREHPTAAVKTVEYQFFI